MTNLPPLRQLSEAQIKALQYARALCEGRLDVEAPFYAEIIRGYVAELDALLRVSGRREEQKNDADWQQDALKVLKWLDVQGGLGHDKHDRIRKLIESPPSIKETT